MLRAMTYLEHTSIDRDLVLEFFLVLSRVEFALKVTGYASGSRKGVSPDWEKFGREIRGKFYVEKTKELVEACDFYLGNPPQKQCLDQYGQLDWVHSLDQNLSTPEKLQILVRRVRNNLFHGGKYNQQLNEETARNEQLLRNGIIILLEAVSLVPNVHRAYDGVAI